MTDNDREYIAGDGDASDSQRYQAVSRVRSRFDELVTDLECLEEHRPDLLEELRENDEIQRLLCES
ncbi:hypothetical protein GCM10009006_37150 [Haloarcula argentinensis]|uniref:Uncharacterized protein n=1 Tax=Haloarcula argentinensis TaxID=43776 RepID=A0A830FXJ6_HALAR|nr:hypothetical protein GCM10009006_37150 [Haloarcula argentinensis]